MGQGITSVDFTELRGSPSGSATPDGTTAQRKLKVPWDDYPAAMREALGWAERQSAGKLTRWLPDPFPKLTVRGKPDYPSLYAVSVGWEPWGYDWKDPADPVGGGGANTVDETPQGPVHRYSHAILTVGYSTLPYNVYADDEIAGDESRRFINVTSRASAKMVSLRGMDLLWDPAELTNHALDNKSINADALMVEAEETIQVAWHRLPVEAVASVTAQPDLAAGSAYLDNLVGRVNSAAIWGYAAGTLLFYPADIQVKTDWYMGDSCEVMLQMVHNRNGHNRIFCPTDTGAGYRLVKVNDPAGSRRIFAEASFADAFKIP